MPDDLVRRVWPELKVGDLTFLELLSHRAGLPGVNSVVEVADRRRWWLPWKRRSRFGSREWSMGIMLVRLDFF